LLIDLSPAVLGKSAFIGVYRRLRGFLERFGVDGTLILAADERRLTLIKIIVLLIDLSLSAAKRFLVSFDWLDSALAGVD
jgi:hypothetical protein